MAQAFVTTYQNHYRGHKQPRRKSKKPKDRHAASAPPGDYWRDTLVEQNTDLNLPLAEGLIKQSTRKLLYSTYQMNYCSEMVREKEREMRELIQKFGVDKSTEVQDQLLENELLRYCKELYSERSSKLLPPTETARRVFGYMRPESMYTPLTHYQMEYGKVGYDIMSDPMQYLDKHKEKEERNSTPPECTAEGNILKIKAFKHCEDIKNGRIEKEKAETQKKLEEIMENLDRMDQISKFIGSDLEHGHLIQSEDIGFYFEPIAVT